MMTTRNESFITMSQVATRLGISVRTVKNWARNGRNGRHLDVIRIGHRTVRTTWSAVEQFIGATEQLTVPPPISRAAIERELAILERRHGIKIDPKGKTNGSDSGSDQASAEPGQVPALRS